MTNVTITTAATMIPEIWDVELNRAVEFDITIAKLFTDRSKLLSGGGDTVNRATRHNLTAQTKSAGSDATAEAITEDTAAFVVSTHQIVIQEIEDIASVQSKYDLRAEFNEAAGYALARAQDAACAAVIDDNTTQTVGVLGSELLFDDWLTVRAYLRNSAIKGPYKGVVAPATYNGLLKQEQFTRSDAYGASADAITQAKVGSIFNISLYESQLTVGTSPSSYGCVWGGAHYWKVIQKAPKLDAWYSPAAKAWIVAVDQIYGMFEVQEANEGAALTTSARLGSVRLEAIK